MKPKAKTAGERIARELRRFKPPYFSNLSRGYADGLRFALSCLPPTPPRRKGKKK